MMDGVIVLNQREVTESLDMQSVIQAVEEAFQFKSCLLYTSSKEGTSPKKPLTTWSPRTRTC